MVGAGRYAERGARRAPGSRRRRRRHPTRGLGGAIVGFVDQFVAVLLNGERRRLELPAHTGSVANAIDRLDDWIATADGGWVNKQHIIEVRPLSPGNGIDDELPVDSPAAEDSG